MELRLPTGVESTLICDGRGLQQQSRLSLLELSTCAMETK
jgi:hypothetical protein